MLLRMIKLFNRMPLAAMTTPILLGSLMAAQEARPSPQQAPATQNSPAAAQALPAQGTPENQAETQLLPTNDPKEIIRRSIEIDRRTLELARTYTCQHREVLKHLDKNGNVKSTEIKTYDISFFYGEEYSRLIMIDDKPLNEKEQKKEDEK